MWPDLFHRISRRVAASLAASEGNVLLKKLNRVFKYSRGPFATDKNGRVLQEFKIALVKALKRGHASELAQMYLCGVARDLGRDVSSFDVTDLIAALEKKAGLVTSANTMVCIVFKCKKLKILLNQKS